MKEIRPIAFFRSPLTSKFGIPRQSGLADNLVGKIVFEPQYQREEALRGLEDFDYLWLIWGFSANKSTDEGKLTVRPPRLGGNERLGVFATRSPFRPNGLGLSSVRIKRIVDGVIERPRINPPCWSCSRCRLLVGHFSRSLRIFYLLYG